MLWIGLNFIKQLDPQRKWSHSTLLSLNCSQRLSAEQETVFISKNHFHKLKCLLNLDISSQSSGSQHLLSVLYCNGLRMGCPCSVYCWCCHQGYLTRKCIWSCHFLVEKPSPFLFSWVALCLALILFQAPFFFSLPAGKPDTPVPMNILPIPQNAWLCLWRCMHFLSHCQRNHLVIFQISHLQRNFLYMSTFPLGTFRWFWDLHKLVALYSILYQIYRKRTQILYSK